MENASLHQSVLLHEAVDGLAIKPDGIYVDGTFGRGGHSSEILQRLSQRGRLIAIDRDPEAIRFAQQKFQNDKRFLICSASFSQLGDIVREHSLNQQIDGILLDLGVSSPQLDIAERGFSFTNDGPLDMRMDPTSGISAAQWVATAKERDIADVLKTLGEERFAKRIANAIVTRRNIEPITTTLQLANIVKEANPKWEKHKHPATRSFQAIRIFINDELNELPRALDQSLEMLKVGGRLAVISFHSLEDRVVKRFLRKQSQEQLPKGVPVTASQSSARMRCIGKAIMPSSAETEANPRARSAVLRIGEKLS